ncbi:MAG: helix-turn-helix transcriptional regulator [Dermatophilaceae bacterium]
MTTVPLPRALLMLDPGARQVPLTLVPSPDRQASARSGIDTPAAVESWPGRSAGLSQREAEMICWISRGLTNDEIARLTFLSPNSVKSFVRSAYRKIGATRRAHAVLWGVAHDMRPERLPARAPSAARRSSASRESASGRAGR